MIRSRHLNVGLAALLIVFLECVLVAPAAEYNFRDVCPYTDFCTSNSTRVITNNKKTPCCGSCSCEDDCWKRGNCCPDIEGTFTDSATETCTLTIVKSSMFDINGFYNGLNGGGRRYFTVDKCPKTEKNDTLLRACEGAIQSTIDDIVWVSDLETNRIFSNKHCAKCNGVLKYVKWNLWTGCIDLLQGNISPDLVSIPGHCRLFVTPPDFIQTSQNLCLIPDVTKCNSTGLWQNYDSNINELCEAYSLNFVVEGFIYTRVYRNIFCALCNGVQRMKDTCTQFIVDTGRGAVDSLTALIDLQIFDSDKGISRQDGCAIHEVQDPLNLSCLKLACPVLTNPLYGKCRKRTKRTYLLGIETEYGLTPIPGKIKYGLKNESEYSISKLRKAIQASLYEELGLITCAKCSASREVFKTSIKERQVGNTTVPWHLSLRILFYTDENCQEDKIIKVLSSMAGKEMLVRLHGGEYITFKVQLATKPMEDIGSMRVHINDEMGPPCPAVDFFEYGEYTACPMVNLGKSHYSELMKRTSTTLQKIHVDSLFQIKSVQKVSSANGSHERINVNFTTSVCLDDFKALVARLNNAAGQCPDMGYFGFVLFSFISLTCRF